MEIMRFLRTVVRTFQKHEDHISTIEQLLNAQRLSCGSNTNAHQDLLFYTCGISAHKMHRRITKGSSSKLLETFGSVFRIDATGVSPATGDSFPLASATFPELQQNTRPDCSLYTPTTAVEFHRLLIKTVTYYSTCFLIHLL